VATKVPGYLLQRPADCGARKPSAVERLEADKAKYVKSLHVASTRQEPVQPLLPARPPGLQRSKSDLTRANSDIVSLAGPSAGPASSEGGCSRRSSATIEELARERVPYGVSVIERNARVIKWLYGLRQARETPAAEG
ncbi:hypothetical protein E2I00_005073, partial [Balaenoptera physalus]